MKLIRSIPLILRLAVVLAMAPGPSSATPKNQKNLDPYKMGMDCKYAFSFGKKGEYPPPSYKAGKTPRFDVNERVQDYEFPIGFELAERKPVIPNIINGRIPRIFYLREHNGEKGKYFLLAKTATYSEIALAIFGPSLHSELLDYFPSYGGNYVYSIIQGKAEVTIGRREIENKSPIDIKIKGEVVNGTIQKVGDEHVYFLIKSQGAFTVYSIKMDGREKIKSLDLKSALRSSARLQSFAVSDDQSRLAVIAETAPGKLELRIGNLNNRKNEGPLKSFSLTGQTAELQILPDNSVLVYEREIGRLSLVKGSTQRVISESGVIENPRMNGVKFGYDSKRNLLYYLQEDSNGHRELVSYSIKKGRVQGSGNLRASAVEFEVHQETGKVILVTEENGQESLLLWDGTEALVISEGFGPYNSQSGISNGFQISPWGQTLVFSELHTRNESQTALNASTRNWYAYNLDGKGSINEIVKTHGYSRFFWSPDGRLAALTTRATQASLTAAGRDKRQARSNTRLFFVQLKGDAYFTGAPPQDWKAIFD